VVEGNVLGAKGCPSHKNGIKRRSTCLSFDIGM
jgi:hypothetical protein